MMNNNKKVKVIRNCMKKYSKEVYEALYTSDEFYFSNYERIRNNTKKLINVYKLIEFDLSWYKPSKKKLLEKHYDDNKEIRKILRNKRCKYTDIFLKNLGTNIEAYEALEYTIFMKFKGLIEEANDKIYYLENYDSFELETKERIMFEHVLNLRDFNQPHKIDIYNMTLEEIKQNLDEEDFRKLLVQVDATNGIDVYTLLP